jgi:hypothetical protein
LIASASPSGDRTIAAMPKKGTAEEAIEQVKKGHVSLLDELKRKQRNRVLMLIAIGYLLGRGSR